MKMLNFNVWCRNTVFLLFLLPPNRSCTCLNCFIYSQQPCGVLARYGHPQRSTAPELGEDPWAGLHEGKASSSNHHCQPHVGLSIFPWPHFSLIIHFLSISPPSNWSPKLINSMSEYSHPSQISSNNPAINFELETKVSWVTLSCPFLINLYCLLWTVLYYSKVIIFHMENWGRILLKLKTENSY